MPSKQTVKGSNPFALTSKTLNYEGLFLWYIFNSNTSTRIEHPDTNRDGQRFESFRDHF